MSGHVILEATRLIPDCVAALVPVDTLQDVDWKPGDGLDGWIAPSGRTSSPRPGTS